MTPPLSDLDLRIVASLDPLAQPFALLHRDACLRLGMPHYYFTQGARSDEYQSYLDKKLGAGAASAKVSKHVVGMAWDANNWDAKPIASHWWSVFGQEAERLGLVWGGRFASKDLGHVEMPASRKELESYRAVTVTALALLVAGSVALIARAEKP